MIKETAAMNRLMIYLLPLILILLSSCQSEKVASPSQWHAIVSRDNQTFVYRAYVPTDWTRQDPDPQTSLEDTKIPVCEFFITQGDERIRLTIHLFPYTSYDSRVPPKAQIARWKKQFETFDALSSATTPCSHGGFYGLCFEGTGEQNSQPTKVLGWSMQLAQLYDQSLEFQGDALKRADYTIKAVGPPSFMTQKQAQITAFAESFELIDELSIAL